VGLNGTWTGVHRGLDPELCKSTTRMSIFYLACNRNAPPPARALTSEGSSMYSNCPERFKKKRRNGHSITNMEQGWAGRCRSSLDTTYTLTEFRGKEVSKRRSLVESEDGSQSCD